MKRYRSPKRKWQRRITVIVLLALLITVGLSVYFSATRVLKSVAQEKLKSYATEAINEAVYATLANGLDYGQIVTVKQDNGGNILSLSANAYQINRISRDVSHLSQQRLQALLKQGIDLPLGAFFGIEAWSGFGPSVTVKVISISAVNCTFSSQFLGAGINQTKHSIYLTATANLSLVLPTGTTSFSVPSEVLLCETVLVGKVPNTLFMGSLFEN